MESEDKEMIIFGDFNNDYKVNDSLIDNPLYVIECLFALTQIVTKPTRTTSTSSKCLDLIFTTIPERHVLCDVAKIALSDHYLIYTCLDFKIDEPQHKLVKYRDYKKFNESLFLADIRNCDILHNCQSNNTNLTDLDECIWTRWKQSFLSICNKTCSN